MTHTLTKLYTRAQARWTCRDDKGMSTLEYAIITGAVVVLALLVVGIVRTAVNKYAADIN